MATQPQPTPHPPPQPTPPPKPPEAPKPDEAAKPASDAATETVVDEQRKRSDEIEAMGVDAWKAAHDDRAHTDQQPKTVAGVTKTVEVHVKSH